MLPPLPKDNEEQRVACYNISNAMTRMGGGGQKYRSTLIQISEPVRQFTTFLHVLPQDSPQLDVPKWRHNLITIVTLTLCWMFKYEC